MLMLLIVFVNFFIHFIYYTFFLTNLVVKHVVRQEYLTNDI